MWNRIFGELDQLWALFAQPTIESIALALGFLVMMQLLWELARSRAEASAVSTVRAGHRVKLYRAAAREGAGDRTPSPRGPNPRGPNPGAGVDHAP